MSLHLKRQVEQLKKMILSLGGRVEEAVENATHAIHTRDAQLARGVVDRDDEIDAMEIDVEEECLHTLALHQPVAFDLRYVVAVLKINNDLERIGDLAANIAEQALFLSEMPKLETPPFDLPGMTDRVTRMVKQSLDALVNIDVAKAQTIRQSDQSVDEIHRTAYRAVDIMGREHPNRLDQLVHYLNVSKNLERIGDHAVNIAEDILYMAEGDIMRHGGRRSASGDRSASRGGS